MIIATVHVEVSDSSTAKYTMEGIDVNEFIISLNKAVSAGQFIHFIPTNRPGVLINPRYITVIDFVERA